MVKHQVNIGDMESLDCQCFKPPFRDNDFKSIMIGIDKTKGCFAEVTYEECVRCGNFMVALLL
jgi:hypothetical protein